MSRLGTFNQSSLQKYNCHFITLAEGIGMKALSERLGIHWVKIHEWARGEHVPDFRKPEVSARYERAEHYCLRTLGLSLAEIFGQAEELPEMVGLDAVSGSYWPTRYIDDRIDIERLLSRLTARERLILFAKSNGVSFHDIADEIGCCPERARQLFERAAEKARRALKGWR